MAFDAGRQAASLSKVTGDIVAAATGEQKVIIDERAKTFIDYSGERYRYDVKSANEIIWASERAGWNHIWLYER
jgi:hypothetical protein